MPESGTNRRRSLRLRIKVALVSLAGFIVAVACSRQRENPPVLCYEMVAPSPTPTTHVVLCYEPVLPTMTMTPAPSPLFTSPLSPLPTPTPTPDPEARRQLRDRLVAEGRFPASVIRRMAG